MRTLPGFGAGQREEGRIRGEILADDRGLGKTLTALSLVYWICCLSVSLLWG
ncbi:uncharacterized protein BDW43DRAFT_42130 [Aspergillus alliaceus]|uniref:uncharacterized protein n=1 Tax=Petromyces alliaceus TaxID=209559 RepID=UPI0012A69CCB|nr:uncharacterized protein BDW43DRAFT_42130 [Aspergillus alliaceus]KAB8235202.1 hypothetical protein BDW43DRAFT_42130 [Aspergillus alliaceus]